MIKIKKCDNINISIIGVGGTGSHLISFLSQLIGNDRDLKSRCAITLVDGDIVEEHNLRTQKFLSQDISSLKAEVLAERYQSVFDINIGYMDKYITERKDIYDSFSLEPDYSYALNIIVSCVDNNKARAIIDEAFNRDSYSHLIYIDAGNSSGEDELFGQAVVGYKQHGTCYLPSVSNYFPQMLEEEDEEELEELSCGERMARNIQNIGANITSACTVFNILNNILSFNQIPGDLFTFNATQLEANSLKLNKKEEQQKAV